MSRKRCVLAYSGGLDTSAILPWLNDRGYEVHALLVDVGQDEDLPILCDQARYLGAHSAIVRDAKPAMLERVVPFAIGLGATYEGNYRLGTALARPFIAEEQVRLAQQLGGATLVHGATGKGNDQIRFEFAYQTLAPTYEILAPWKTWDFTGRRDLIDFLDAKGLNLDFKVGKDYSLDENLWHLSVEGGALEDPEALLDVDEVLAAVRHRFAQPAGSAAVPAATALPAARVTSPVRTAAATSGLLEIEFQQGVPVALDGKAMPLSQLLARLNADYRHAPWAWDLVLENRFTGVKSRGVYINPAATLLHHAINALARTTLNKACFDLYTRLGADYGSMLYRGEYFSAQRLALEAAAQTILSDLNGRVTLRLGQTLYAARIFAARALFSRQGATFEASDFSHQDAEGFARLSWLSSIGHHAVSGVSHADTVETTAPAAPSV